MKKNQSILWGIGIVVAVAVVYFGFFYPPPATEELQGAIGTGQKHQTGLIMFGIPVMFLFMTQVPEFETADLSSLRFFLAGGSPCPRE